MKQTIAAFTFLALTAALTPQAHARDHGWAVAGGFIAGTIFGHVVTRAADPPVYHTTYVTAPPPQPVAHVVAQPQVIVQPPPVVVYPQPVYVLPPPACAPPVYVAPPVCYPPRPLVSVHFGFGPRPRRLCW